MPATEGEIARAHREARSYLDAHPETDGVNYEIDISGFERPVVFYFSRAMVIADEKVGKVADHQDRANYWESRALELRRNLAEVAADYAAVPALCCDTCRERVGRADRQRRQQRGENVEV